MRVKYIVWCKWPKVKSVEAQRAGRLSALFFWRYYARFRAGVLFINSMEAMPGRLPITRSWTLWALPCIWSDHSGWDHPSQDSSDTDEHQRSVDHTMLGQSRSTMPQMSRRTARQASQTIRSGCNGSGHCIINKNIFKKLFQKNIF